MPLNWVASDPCGSSLVGITCNNNLRVVSIILSSIGLNGTLPVDIQFLNELQELDLSGNPGLTGTLPPSIGTLSNLRELRLVGCSFSGEIPDLRSLQQLSHLALNDNQFSGGIPPSIGSLLNLYWLDLSDNKITGTIPVSNGNTPGLDMLTGTKHFHFGNNQLSGPIPAKLFSSNMQLLHVLFNNNNLSGSIPSTLGLVVTLQVVRLDGNSLTGPVPSNINNLASVGVLHLSNNKLTGPLPNLTGMSLLSYLDLSNNTFDASDVPPWFSTLPSLNTLKLRNNNLDGTLNLTNGYSSALQLVDLQNNEIDGIEGGTFKNELLLVGNPICEQLGPENKYCMIQQQSTPYSTLTHNCTQILCSGYQSLSPNCQCAYPYEGTLYFRAPFFSDVGNSLIFHSLEKTLETSFQAHQLPVDSVSLNHIFMNSYDYLQISLQIFPAGKTSFSQAEVSSIGHILPNSSTPPIFGPFFFIGQPYKEETPSLKSKHLPLIIGASVGGFFLALVLIGLAIYATRQKGKAQKVVEQSQPFASWDPTKSSGSSPQLKGARWFSFDELKQCTNNFSEANDIGSGGYGKVYRGILPTGQLVAVKRAQQGSMQGGLEFKTEIELLSRVHHKNIVSLVGFCFDQGEQMLVYEYVPNGTLKESLSGKSGVRLDWKRRLKVALGAARGLAYLHEMANPPIVHRDVKSTNILLDDRLTAKVADFGLSKPLGDNQKGHVTTQVKGTMGYLDPEYYMTQQLTEKSDVYSFGVLLLELITARRPIERGRYIVREVKVTMDKTKDLYGLDELLDPAIGLATPLVGFGKFVDMAMKCVEESGVDRPTMSEVVKEIEIIMQLAGINPYVESNPTSSSYEGTSRGHSHHPYANEAFFDYSGGQPSSKIEPK